MLVRDVMTREVTTLKRNDKLTIADDVMRLGRIRHMPVLEDDDQDLAGILSQRDLFRGALVRALGYGEVAQRRVMNTILVKEVMTTDVVTTAPDTPLAEAARQMVERKIGCLPVMDNGELVGILTESDFVELAAKLQGWPSVACLLEKNGCRVLEASDNGRFAPYMELYLKMADMQLTYDPLKILDFDHDRVELIKRGVGLFGELAAAGKIAQARFVARKE